MNYISDQRLDIISPVYNEEDGIHDFYNAILNESEKIIYDGIVQEITIILIDDGSNDDTWKKIEELESISFPVSVRIKGIRLSRNFGKEAAIACGLKISDADYTVIIDSDLQHPPECIAPMLKQLIDNQADVIDAVKRCRGDEKVTSRIAANLFYYIMTKLTGMNMKGASDFKIITKKTRHAWACMPEQALFFRGMISWVGFKHETYLFDVANRNTGESKWPVRHLINLALHAITAYSTIPLKIMSGCGFAFVLFAIIISIQTLFQYIGGNAVTGFTTVILMLSISFGLIMIGLGIIGEYLARIYGEVKGRPRYFITETTSKG